MEGVIDKEKYIDKQKERIGWDSEKFQHDNGYGIQYQKKEPSAIFPSHDDKVF